jgi:hypothetical protein
MLAKKKDDAKDDPTAASESKPEIVIDPIIPTTTAPPKAPEPAPPPAGKRLICKTKIVCDVGGENKAFGPGDEMVGVSLGSADSLIRLKQAEWV